MEPIPGSLRLIQAALIILLLSSSCISDIDPLREYMSLNGEWKFTAENMGKDSSKDTYDSKPANFFLVNVPHCWNVDSLTETYYGQAWYEKEFQVPKKWRNKRIKLEFERIYRDARIWVNDEMAGTHLGSGYTSFGFDITDHLIFGKKNKIVISVNNAPGEKAIPFMRSFDWAMDGGIIGNVDLIATGAPSVHNVMVHSKYNREDDNISGEVQLEVWLDIPEKIDVQEIDLGIVIKEDNQKSSDIVYSGDLKMEVKNSKGYANISLPSVNLWHFDDPNLYELEVTPIYLNTPTDHYTTNFGFRKFEITHGELFLNDEKVRLTGVEWMPGSNPEYGFAEPDEYISRVLNDMKNANCIFTRFHWQQSKKTIDLCNRLGILVQEEIPLWQQPVDFSGPPLSEIVETHAKEMIFRDFNAPCIIAWGIGNELQSTNENTIKSILGLKNLVESMDTSRIISYVSNHVGDNPEKDVSAHFDWIMMNDYYGTWFGRDASAAGKALDEMHRIYPEKPIIISEWGLCEPQFKGGDERRIKDMYDHYNEYIQRPFVQGFIYFSFNDYRTHMGEEGTGKLRRRVHGVVDLHLEHKLSYKHLKQVCSPVEIAILEDAGDSLLIRIMNKKTLPYYSLKNYSLSVSPATGTAPLLQKQINIMNPGDSIDIYIPDLSHEQYHVTLTRNTGHNVLRIPATD